MTVLMHAHRCVHQWHVWMLASLASMKGLLVNRVSDVHVAGWCIMASTHTVMVVSLAHQYSITGTISSTTTNTRH